MKLEKVLLITIILMHVITLTNITLFEGEWNGIALALSSLLFVASLFFYFSSKKNERQES